MKKIIIVLFFVTLLFICSLNDSKVVIPKESIRYRIIASDNSIDSQKLKWSVNEDVMPFLIEKVSLSEDINNARNNIQKNMNEINDIVSKYTSDFNINYGINYFPQKEYKNVSYNEGNYESLVITIGNGEGKNFWCVMFPPLCLLEAQKGNIDEVKYDLYIKRIINKYF